MAATCPVAKNVFQSSVFNDIRTVAGDVGRSADSCLLVVAVRARTRRRGTTFVRPIGTVLGVFGRIGFHVVIGTLRARLCPCRGGIFLAHI
jgi:hypothetical protein